MSIGTSRAAVMDAARWISATGQVNVNNLRTNALLKRNEWQDVDGAVVDVARTQLTVVNDIVAAGLVRNLGDIGTTVAVYQQLTDMDSAQVNMSVETNVDQDRLVFSDVFVPVPIHAKSFKIDGRQLAAGRRGGESLDTTHISVATRKVLDSMEEMTVNGHSIVVGQEGANRSIYGFTTLPQRNTDTAANYGGGDFGTEDNGYKTINGMITALAGIGFRGPYGCYISRNQHSELMNLKTDGSGKSEIRTIEENLGLSYVKVSDSLADGNVVVFQMTPDVVQIGMAQDVTVVEWDSRGGMVDNFVVMSCMVPLVKSTAAGIAGVAHATAA